ncbi:M23 family metallopeptidase [bacterium]|nr:M23 family metallopeptidase [bacterium]
MKFRIVLLALCMVVMLSVVNILKTKSHSNTAQAVSGMVRKHQQSLKPTDLATGNCSVVCESLMKGETLGTLLQRYNVSANEIHKIGVALTEIQSPKKIRAGAAITIFRDIDTGSIVELDIEKSRATRIVLKNTDEIWSAYIEDLILFNRIQECSGQISDSLWNSARKRNMPPEIILGMADMFGWQVDFTSGLRQGDSFKVYFNQKVIKDGGLLAGKIVAASFVNEGKSFWSFRYVLPDGSVDYFDEDGNSMRREFLKTPLSYRRISSGYTKRRYHPILKIYRPHFGIDYAAPSGTPVSALGDGIVVYCGTRGGYGKYVQIKHGDAYETCYGHLSRYGKGIRKGVHVKQGNVIGYVGSTGLSTGPHLDFRVKYRGNFINPNNIRSEPAEPVPEEIQTKFQAFCDVWIDRLKK